MFVMRWAAQSGNNTIMLFPCAVPILSLSHTHTQTSLWLAHRLTQEAHIRPAFWHNASIASVELFKRGRRGKKQAKEWLSTTTQGDMHSLLHSRRVCIIYKITLSAAKRKRWVVKMYFIKIAWLQPPFCHFRHFCLVFGGHAEYKPLSHAQMRAHV